MKKVRELFRRNNKEKEHQNVPSEEAKEVREAQHGNTDANGEGKNDECRYTLLVEDTFELAEEEGIAAVGVLHGQMKVGDEVYLCHPARPIQKFAVMGMEIGPNHPVFRAKNQKVALQLEVKDKNKIPKYSVLCSSMPQQQVDGTTAIENPRLVGMTMEYPRLHQNMDYFNLLVYDICHTSFVAPVYVDQVPEENGDKTVTLNRGTQLSFPLVKKWNDETQTVFPVFTDWGALWNWNGVFENRPQKTVILRFPDVVSITESGHAGMVINPFGPVPVYLPMDLIRQITQNEGYREEFGTEAKDSV